MTLKFLKDSLESTAAKRLRFTTTNSGTFDVVFDDDHQVVGAFSSAKPFNKAQRAGFSTNSTIANAAADVNALDVELAAHTDIFTEWRESYVVDTLANLAELGDDENITVDTVDDPISDVEREQLIEPIDVDSLVEPVMNELNARKEANKQLGLTDEQFEQFTLKLNDDDATVKRDEDNFVHLAASASIPLGSAFGYSSGFYYSAILNTIVNSVKAGVISVLDGDGQEFTINALKPENTDPQQNSLAYLDSERPDGRDEENALQLSREGETELEEDRKKGEAKKFVVPELPAFDLGTTPEQTAEPANGEAHEDDTTVLPPVLPQPAQTAEETVESLADGVERARTFLATLKAEHADVTAQLKGLTETASKRLEKLITSLKEDRTEIDEQIEQLRDKKADIDVQIADTREKKAVVDERLSHKPELEAHAHELADKIKVLSDALANRGEKAE